MDPASSIYYEVAENGLFEVRDTALFRSVTRVQGVPGLLGESEQLELRGPRLSQSLLEEVVCFFSAVYEACGGEAAVVLFYNPAREVYLAEAPSQTLPVYKSTSNEWQLGLSVRYSATARPDGFLRCGSIHSHAGAPACASHIDRDDEEHEDGLHVVVGGLDRARLLLSAAFVAAGLRFQLSPSEVLEPFNASACRRRPAPRQWLARVQLEMTGAMGLRRTVSLIDFLKARNQAGNLRTAPAGRGSNHDSNGRKQEAAKTS